MELLLVSSDEVAELLSMEQCVQVMKQALSKLYDGQAICPVRQALQLPDSPNVLGSMPAIDTESKKFGSKLLSVFPHNHTSGYESHQGIVLLFDLEYGRPLAIINAGEITGIRTAAVSAIATDLLARQEANNLAILGCGLQAFKHVEAIRLVRPINRIFAWDLYPTATKKFADKISRNFDLEVEIHEDIRSCVKEADIICTLTPSLVPILFGRDVSEGTHINAVGACSPKARELDTKVVVKSHVFVDQMAATLQEAGDILFPISEGKITENHIVGEIGQLLNQKIKGRNTPEEITIFEALGLAIEDLAAANFIYGNAISAGKGTRINI
jgi:alanine dehydrogenase